MGTIILRKILNWKVGYFRCPPCQTHWVDEFKHDVQSHQVLHGPQLLIALGCRRHYKIGNPFERMEMISRKTLQRKTQNPEWEWTELIKLLPSTPASDPLTTHSYFISPLSMIHTTLFLVGTPIVPPSPHLLLPRLYGKQYTRV